MTERIDINFSYPEAWTFLINVSRLKYDCQNIDIWIDQISSKKLLEMSAKFDQAENSFVKNLKKIMRSQSEGIFELDVSDPRFNLWQARFQELQPEIMGLSEKPIDEIISIFFSPFRLTEAAKDVIHSLIES